MKAMEKLDADLRKHIQEYTISILQTFVELAADFTVQGNKEAGDAVIEAVKIVVKREGIEWK